MEQKKAAMLVDVYSIILSLVFILFAFLAISGRGYASLERSGDALHAVVSIGVRYLAVVLILMLGLLLRDRSMVLAGFIAAAVITLADFTASVLIDKPPAPVALISALVSATVIWIPQGLCVRWLWRQRRTAA